MKKEEDIERLVADTLNSIDNIQQVDANEYLFTKIQARMQEGNQAGQTVYVKVMARLSVALLLFTGLNMLSYYYLAKAGGSEAKPAAASAVQSVASELNLTTGIYNY